VSKIESEPTKLSNIRMLQRLPNTSIVLQPLYREDDQNRQSNGMNRKLKYNLPDTKILIRKARMPKGREHVL
jgi:hypothetical protein